MVDYSILESFVRNCDPTSDDLDYPVGASENGDEGVVEFLGRRVFDDLLVDLDLLLEGAEENGLLSA